MNNIIKLTKDQIKYLEYIQSELVHPDSNYITDEDKQDALRIIDRLLGKGTYLTTSRDYLNNDIQDIYRILIKNKRFKKTSPRNTNSFANQYWTGTSWVTSIDTSNHIIGDTAYMYS